MTCDRCAQSPCICVDAAKPVRALPPTHRYKPLHEGPYLTKEEFGLDLFEAIKAQAALRQAEKNRAMYERKGLPLAAAEAAKAIEQYQSRLHKILAKNTIAPDDLRRLLAIS